MKENIIQKIKRLKKEKNATIIAHFYQIPEIQDLADFVGDSLAMAKYGKASSAETLVICGVQFMAESAKILSPEKTILLPHSDAGCPMADMVEPKELQNYKTNHPDRYIVSYVNTSAAVKALTDICVTSSNALHIIKKIDKNKILFLPDRNLGRYIHSKVPNKDMTFWPGYCYVHDQLRIEDINEMKSLYPNAEVLVHPECDPDIVALADFVGSTSGIISYASTSKTTQFIIATENGVLHRLKQNEPNKEFYLASSQLECKDMKKISLENVLNSLENTSKEILLDEETQKAAYMARNKMLELSLDLPQK